MREQHPPRKLLSEGNIGYIDESLEVAQARYPGFFRRDIRELHRDICLRNEVQSTL